MGTWSPDILGGDHPMDVLGYLEDIIGYDEGLYPLEFNPEQAAGVRILLETNGTAILDRKWDLQDVPVLAAAYLSVGAEMPESISEGALKACRDEIVDLQKTNSDGWRDPEARIAVLENHIRLIEQHAPGKITPIQHKGLFATLGI